MERAHHSAPFAHSTFHFLLCSGVCCYTHSDTWLQWNLCQVDKCWLHAHLKLPAGLSDTDIIHKLGLKSATIHVWIYGMKLERCALAHKEKAIRPLSNYSLAT